jgi:DNA invertase Pin-like site-specific DNA recombinase
MKIGNVRVSKQEQHEALQIDALKEAGCEKWFLDKITDALATSALISVHAIHPHFIG